MARSLGEFLIECGREPEELYRVGRRIKPHSYEVTALLEHLDLEDRLGMVLFEAPENLLGDVEDIRLVRKSSPRASASRGRSASTATRGCR